MEYVKNNMAFTSDNFILWEEKKCR